MVLHNDRDGFITSGSASRPNGGGNSMSPQSSLQRYSAVESSLAARSNMCTLPSDTTMGEYVMSCDLSCDAATTTHLMD